MTQYLNSYKRSQHHLQSVHQRERAVQSLGANVAQLQRSQRVHRAGGGLPNQRIPAPGADSSLGADNLLGV